MSPPSPSVRRIAWIDLLRALAICLVVLVHTTERTYSMKLEAISSYPLHRALLAQSLFTAGRLGVLFFLFITGYLLLCRRFDHRRTLDFYRNSLLGLLVTTELWIVLYNLFNHFFLHKDFSLSVLFRNLFFFQRADMSHMWYMPVILGLYLLLPFVATALEHIDSRLLPLPLAIALCSAFVLPEINVLQEALGLTKWNALLSLEFAGGAYGLCLILGWMTWKGFLDRLPAPLLVTGGICAFLFTVWLQWFSYRQGVAYNVWYNNATLLICAFSIFLLARRWDLPCPALLQDFSRCSFGVYLVHNPINRLLINSFPMKNGIGRLAVIWTLTLVLSWGVVHLLSRNKTLGKWLFFVK